MKIFKEKGGKKNIKGKFTLKIGEIMQKEHKQISKWVHDESILMNRGRWKKFNFKEGGWVSYPCVDTRSCSAALN
jgi:hypothetical protein